MAAKPLPIQIPLGREDGFRGVIDLIDRKVYRLGSGHPGDGLRRRGGRGGGPRGSRKETTGHDGNAERTRRRPDAEVPRRRRGLRAGAAERPSAGRPSPWRSSPSSTGPPSGTRASSRSSTPSSTTCRRPADVRPVAGHHPRTQAVETRPRLGRGALLRPRLQDHQRPVPRQPGLLPGLFRQGQGRPGRL